MYLDIAGSFAVLFLSYQLIRLQKAREQVPVQRERVQIPPKYISGALADFLQQGQTQLRETTPDQIEYENMVRDEVADHMLAQGQMYDDLEQRMKSGKGTPEERRLFISMSIDFTLRRAEYLVQKQHDSWLTREERQELRLLDSTIRSVTD